MRPFIKWLKKMEKLGYSVRGWSFGWELGKDYEFQLSVSVLALGSLTETLRLFLEFFKISQSRPGMELDMIAQIYNPRIVGD